MPNFKPKSKKKIKANSKLNITLDSKHNEKIDEFENIKTVLIPQLQKDKLHYKSLLKDESLSLDKQLEYKDKIKEIRKQIAKISKKEKDYFLNNSEHIFTYFEKKKDVSEGHSKKKILHSFFLIITLIPNFFTASNAAKTSSDIKRFFALDVPFANEEKSTHLILKLLSPGTVIIFLKFSIF